MAKKVSWTTVNNHSVDMTLANTVFYTVIVNCYEL
jgi:hypothetical protein